MDTSFHQEFALAPDAYGWTGKFPGGPHRLFEKEIALEIHTRLIPIEPVVLPDVSGRQANLVRAIAPGLPIILKRVEKELIDYAYKFDPKFNEVIDRPHVWLNCEDDDGPSWTFVVGRADSPDFGYHLEFKGSEFIRIWAAD